MSTKSSRARVAARLRALRGDDPGRKAEGGGGIAARVAALEAAVEENRRLSQRLADVLDVVTELLVPAVDRDDERLRAALAHLDAVVPPPKRDQRSL
jgi:uncharacterized protein YciW